MNQLNRREQSQIASLKNQITEVSRTASRLQQQLDNAKHELVSTKLDLPGIANELDPFRAYQAKVTGTLRRHEILRLFIQDMSDMPRTILAGAEQYRSQITEIEEAAAQRCSTIKLLEEQHALDGDLPVEQRKLLLELKTAQET